MRYPNLFIVGAPKCGTTSLAHWLGQHPDVFAPAQKEPCFFGSDIQFRRERVSEDRYLEHFRRWSGERYALDATPAYLVSEKAAGEIALKSPEAQIIVLVRNPIEAVNSNFHHARYRLTESLSTLEEALDAEEQRRLANFLPKFGSSHSVRYLEMYKYENNIKRYLANFPESQIHVILTEELGSRPREIFQSLCDSIGIGRVSLNDFNFDYMNESGVARWSFLTRIAIHPPEWAGKITKLLFSNETRLKVRKKIRKVNTRTIMNPPIPPTLRKRLEEHFRNDIEWLEHYLQRDLSHWLSAG